MTTFSEQRVFSVSELTKYGSARTWRRIIQRGEIGVIRIGGAVKIPEAELEKFLSERFTPARNRRESRPQTVAEAIDRVLPRLRTAR
jgi:excisionase family DNA binding protein